MLLYQGQTLKSADFVDKYTHLLISIPVFRGFPTNLVFCTMKFSWK